MSELLVLRRRFRLMAASAAILVTALVTTTAVSRSATRATSANKRVQPVGRSPAEQRSYREAMETADQRIADEIRTHSQLMANLEYLTTEIGPRLTGSAQMQRASQWTLERFRSYGTEAHLETTQIPHGWTRGADAAEILAPIQRVIEVRSMGWSRATRGAVEGELVSVPAGSTEDLEASDLKLSGKIAMDQPKPLPPPDEVIENAYDAVIPPNHGIPPKSKHLSRLDWLIRQHPLVLLVDSGKIDDLFNMASVSVFTPSEVPIAFLTHEDASLLERLRKAGPVRLRVTLNGKFSSGAVPASITVAEIPGTQSPGERVLIGGHLDSWDLGQGALDNGTGAMAVLEAARALRALGWKPRRTLTFILFTGEEQSSAGPELFLRNHSAEVNQMDGLLILDTGTGKVFSIALEQQYETAPLLAEIWRPIQEVFDIQPLSTRYFGASDHVPFMERGVPGYFCVQSPDHYREAHHSQADTFDKVLPDEINEASSVIAAWLWNTSEMPEKLPHHAEYRREAEE